MKEETPSLYINNKWVFANGPTYQSTNPSTDQPAWSGNAASDKDVDKAVDAASDAAYDWANLPIEERINYLKQFAQAVNEAKDDLALAISTEIGKPHWEALTEVGAVAAKVDLSIEAFNLRCAPITKGNVTTRFKPHGPVAVFGSFNFPIHIAHGHIIPALLAGNTIVFKPSHQTPLCAQKIIEIWEKINLPKGVLNLVQGELQTAKTLVAHPDIKGIYLTGSVNAGIDIQKTTAHELQKIVALELGGNNPLIIHNCSDLDAAAKLTIHSAFITSGQRCTCARRLILTNSIDQEKFIDKLVSLTQSLKIGPPIPITDDQPFLGPVVSTQSADQILIAQKTWFNHGAQPILEAKRLKNLGPAFVSPGIIDTTNVEDRADKETFGPLLQIIRVNTLENAIDEANNTAFGLASSIFTDNEEDYQRFLNRSTAGLINWNQPTSGASGAAPFGGTGISGNHRPTGFFAADYCSYPTASIENPTLNSPKPLPGFHHE